MTMLSASTTACATSRAPRHGSAATASTAYALSLLAVLRARATSKLTCRRKQSQQAYKSGDGAGAKQFSNQGKAHDAKMDDYNRQASEYIFRENNAPGRLDQDEIDLHGQFVEEAERILEQRIRADQARGIVHLYAIVGKGNHSTGGVQKIKPKVEELCRELGLRYHTDEENEGRIFINLQGGEPHTKPPHQQGGYQQQHGGYQQGGHQQQQGQHGYPGGQQQQHHQQQQQQQHGQQDNDELAETDKRNLPRVLRAMHKHCCVVM